jgi:hypothetical protein
MQAIKISYISLENKASGEIGTIAQAMFVAYNSGKITTTAYPGFN